MATVIIDKYGTKQYRNRNGFHREDGPAYITSMGDKQWILDGRPYRKEYIDGNRLFNTTGFEWLRSHPNGFKRNVSRGMFTWPTL